MNKSGIYKITCLGNGKIYIGSTSDFEERQHKHFDGLKYKYHCNSKLQNAYNKYGRHQFKWEEIEYVLRFESETLLGFGKRLEAREQYYLDTLLFAQEFIKSNHKDRRFHALGLNICPIAGNSTGRPNVNKGKPGKPTSEKTKQKQREAKLKNPTRYWLGRNHSEETKLKIALNNHNIKTAIFITPNGSEVLVTNLTKFARNNGLDPANFWSVYAGKAKSHKGYRLKQAA